MGQSQHEGQFGTLAARESVWDNQNKEVNLGHSQQESQFGTLKARESVWTLKARESVSDTHSKYR